MLDVALTADAGSIDLAEPISFEVGPRPVVWLQALPQFGGGRWPNLASQRCRGNPTFVLTNGGAWVSAAGRPGGFAALKLNQPLAVFNEYVAWTNSQVLGDFAAFAWIYVRNVNDPAYVVQFGSTLSFLITGIAGGGLLRLTDDATFIKQTTTGISGNAWYHVGVTYRSATSSGTFYVSGQPVGTFTQTLAPGTGASKIGGNGSSASGIYLDDVHIYDRTLSEAQAAFVFSDSCAANASRLQRTPQLWFLAEATATPGTLDLVALGVDLPLLMATVAGGCNLPMFAGQATLEATGSAVTASATLSLDALSVTSAIETPLVRGGTQLALSVAGIETVAGVSPAASGSVQMAALSVEPSLSALGMTSQSALVLASLPLHWYAPLPTLSAGADMALASLEQPVHTSDLGIAAGGALVLAPTALDDWSSSLQLVAGANMTVAAIRVAAAQSLAITTLLVSPPKFPGAGTFIRVGLTGVFVHHSLSGEFERVSLTGHIERRD